MLVLLGFMAAVGPASMDIYIPALPAIADDFGISASTTQLTVGVFLIGLGLGQIVAGPLSDAHGRRPPMVVSMAIYMVASVLCAVAPGIETLIAGRFLQGLSAAAGVVIARAVVRDLYSGAKGARYLSRLVLIFGLAPVLAPAVGALVLTVAPWRAVFAVLVAAAAMLLFAVVTRLPETLPPEHRRPSGLRSTLSAFGTLLAHRAFLAYSLVLGLGTAGMVSYVGGSPFLLQDAHGVSELLFAGIFGVNAMAMIAASQINAHIVERVGARRMLGVGVGLLLTSGALLVTFTVADFGVAPIACGLFLMMGSWGLVPPNAIALAMTDHPSIAGSASAVLGAVQYGVGGLAAPLAGLGGRAAELTIPILILTTGALATLMVLLASRSAGRRMSHVL